MKKLTGIMDDFYLDLQREAPETVVSHLLRKAAKTERTLALKAIIKMLVIEHARARHAEAEINNMAPVRRREEAPETSSQERRV